MPTFEHLKWMEFLSRSVFSKAVGREGLRSSLVSKTLRVLLSSRPWWPLHSTSLSCNNTERAALRLLTPRHEKETMQPKRGEVRPGREVLWKKASQESEDLDHFPLIESMWPKKKKKKKKTTPNFHFLIIKCPSSQFLKSACSDLKKRILPKVHWNPNKDCLHLMHYNCQISNRIKSKLLIHFPKFNRNQIMF